MQSRKIAYFISGLFSPTLSAVIMATPSVSAKPKLIGAIKKYTLKEKHLLRNKLRKLRVSLEEPGGLVDRIIYQVGRDSLENSESKVIR